MVVPEGRKRNDGPGDGVDLILMMEIMSGRNPTATCHLPPANMVVWWPMNILPYALVYLMPDGTSSNAPSFASSISIQII
ncbi:unnamed protein product [Sphenostylis stenocarpa]|uniref:Uncharacterized protein n=1 Tax=Sphenostylis stenocarpa TaxID=92480 RepID=A0AA86SPW2_9FABA|nr:unnamed protein product [Sphenostylis stenocarpa]